MFRLRKHQSKTKSGSDEIDSISRMEEDFFRKLDPKEKPRDKPPKKPEAKMPARNDDFESLLKMEEELARKSRRPPAAKPKSASKRAPRPPKPAARPKPARKRVKHAIGKQKKVKKPAAPEKKPVATGQITTQIDVMLGIVKEKKKARIDHLSKKLNVKEKMIEEWAEILEDNNFITIHYPAFGKPELRVREEKKSEKKS